MDKTDRELLKDALELKVQIRNLSSEKNIESKNGFQKKLIPNPKNNN